MKKSKHGRRRGHTYRSDITPGNIPPHYLDDRRKLFKIMCHGDPGRCFFYRGKPLPLCARCMGFYIYLTLGLVFSSIIFNMVSVRPLYILILTMVMITPMVIDGYTQYIGMRRSNNLLRFFTGSLGGLGAGLVLPYILLTILG